MNNPLNTNFKQGKSIVVFGEVLFDLIKQAGDSLDSQAQEVLGGAPGNFAYRVLSQLSPSIDLEVKMVSSIGVDPQGDRIIELLTEKKFDLNYLQRNSQFKTGLVDVTKHPNGDATYVIRKNAAYDHIEYNPDLAVLAKDARLFYFGSLVQREATGSRQTLIRMLESAPVGVSKFVDINLRDLCYNPTTISWSVQQASILKLNDQEVEIVAEAVNISARSPRGFAEELATREKKIVLVTLGAKGALLAYPDGNGSKVLYEPGYQLDLKNRGDTVGCGDSFGAVFAALMLEGVDLQTCLIRANQIGAAVALTNGGMSPVLPIHLAEVRSAKRNIERTLLPLIP